MTIRIIFSLLFLASSASFANDITLQRFVRFQDGTNAELKQNLLLMSLAHKVDYKLSILPNLELWEFANQGDLERFETVAKTVDAITYTAPNNKAPKRSLTPVKPTFVNLEDDAKFLKLFGPLFVDPLMPNDPSLNRQWALKNTSTAKGVNIQPAWQVSHGSREVIAAVVDTGLDLNHPDIQGQVWVNEDEIANNGVDDDNNGYVDDVNGYDFIAKSARIIDGHGHGSHVSGVIGASTNNGVGIAGINWNVRIMPLRAVPNDADETDSDVMEAFTYAANNGARVINCSFGKDESSMAVSEVIEKIKAKGVLVLAAAGNDGVDNDSNPSYPTSFPNDNILSVAATAEDGTLADFTNYGITSVELAAPGDNILSLVKGGRYAAWSGTSMATPMVTGLAAWALAVKDIPDAVELKKMLMNAVVPVRSHSGKTVTGGIISAEKLTQLLTSKTPE